MTGTKQVLLHTLGSKQEDCSVATVDLIGSLTESQTMKHNAQVVLVARAIVCESSPTILGLQSHTQMLRPIATTLRLQVNLTNGLHGTSMPATELCETNNARSKNAKAACWMCRVSCFVLFLMSTLGIPASAEQQCISRRCFASSILLNLVRVMKLSLRNL